MPTVADPGPNAGAVAYRVADLARLTGVSVRNIREYQDRGLLEPPIRAGRVAHYNDEHAVRLRLISRLLERGYTIAVIRDLLEAWAAGRELADVLGFEAVVSKPWSDEPPGRFSLAELRARFGRQLTPSAIARVVAMGILRPAGVRTFVAASPRLLEAGTALVAAGVPLAVVLEVIGHVRDELDRPADRLVGMVFDHVLPPGTRAGLPEGAQLRRSTETIDDLRPYAAIAVEALFAQSLTRAVDLRFAELTERAVAGAPTPPATAPPATARKGARTVAGQRRSSARQDRKRTATATVEAPQNQ